VIVCGCVPLHVPSEAERVWPSCGVPLTVGAVRFAGGPAAMTGVGPDCTIVLPTAFVAVTLISIVSPMSSDVSL